MPSYKSNCTSLVTITGPTTDVRRISSFVLVISAICSTVKSSGSNTSCTSAHALLQAHHLFLSHAHALGNFGSSPSMCGSGYAKRLPQKAPMHAPAFTTTNTISLMRTMELSVAARKKKQMLPEKHLHEKEPLKNPPAIQKTFRIYIFNTFANQVRTIPKKPNAEPLRGLLRL
ncbi:hypothetical protein CQW23_03906 [Capsicum baccatum]|uniref:Uncharacterized protein n=1 Tax=Capsicum baccatum TaxID=33114 RepID=A0A2G2XD68_CAPBA|nr:hypothetical protein CQW23_03906 [Capsicum baccatum]